MERDPTVTGEFTARYTIERELGRGGAAVVYLARDNRQERHVALKVLHKELAQAIGAKRFLREIKHSSSLQHPHLLTILDSGESRGTLYYVMPYMSDGSLRTRIAKEKQLPIDDSLRIMKDVGEALAYAHAKGIVHRDIKPDNVLFSGDHACLADFGIARAVDSVAMDTLTSTGLVVGTPAYMSPEQASGEKTVDARSDQYSLACLLYEMITGLPPFIGATQQSVISQRFTQPPPSMRVHRPNVPDHVERAVKRALAVVPADRFPSVKEFVEALYARSTDFPAPPPSVHRIRRRWFAVGAAAAIAAIAVVAAKPGADWVRGLGGPQVDTTKFVVLPFASQPGGSVDSLDVAASLYARMGRWDGISFIDQGTVRTAVGSREVGSITLERALDIARDLGAGRLIWGTLARDSDRTRIDARLYDVASRSIVRDTVFSAMPTELSDSTLQTLLNALLAVPSLPSEFDDGQNGTNSYAAWQAYGRGITALDTGEFHAARDELSAAVQRDPRFAVANLWLAHVASILSPKAQHEWIPFAQRAVVLRDQLTLRDAARADALLALGRNQYETACNAFGRLVQSDSLDAHAWLSWAECLLLDATILGDRRSPSGRRFRTSYHTAGEGLLRALDLKPRLHSQATFSRLRTAFKSSLNQLRTGTYVDSDSVFMYAYPVASGDTTAFVPYSAAVTESGGARADPMAHARAIDRNRAILLRAARSWVSVAPQSSEAYEALAGVLENAAQLTGQDPNGSAIASIRRARSLSDSVKSVPLAATHVRLLLKAEQFTAARRLADSLLPVTRGSEDFAEFEGLMSALTGKPTGMVKAVMSQHFGDMQTLEAPLLRSAAEYLAYAAVGACSPRLREAEQRVESMLASYVAPNKMSDVRRRLTTDALSLSASCEAGATALRAEKPVSRLVGMQRDFARKDLGGVRAGFDSLAKIRSGSRASQTSPDYLIREAWLRSAIGDTLMATRQADLVLNALPSLPAGTLGNAVQVASLIRVMVLRADLAAAAGDRETARRWAAVVAVLWEGSAAELEPTIARMKVLASGAVVR